MIDEGYQLWYDRTVSPTLTCLYSIINVETLALDINYKQKKNEDILFPINVRVGCHHDSLTQPM
jgi:hypothetical protein